MGENSLIFHCKNDSEDAVGAWDEVGDDNENDGIDESISLNHKRRKPRDLKNFNNNNQTTVPIMKFEVDV